MNQQISSYITGFLLSVVLTFIPYLLVVNQVVTGTTLLVTILTFAMVQLLVQLIFFLHIGRGAGPKWNLYFFIGTFAALLVVVVGSVVIISNLHSNMTTLDQTKRIIDSEGIYQVGGELTGACRVVNANHIITVKDGKLNPSVTVALKCDTLTIINKDTATINLVFGNGKKHLPYAGLSNLTIQKDHTKTITLSQAKNFQLYDNQRPSTTGVITVVDNK